MDRVMWRRLRTLVLLLMPLVAQGADGPNISGTYKLVKRTLPDGTTITAPGVVGLMTFAGGFRNFNVSWKSADGKPVSLSLIAEYTLTDDKYCQTVLFRVANNLGTPGMSNDIPTDGKGCSPVTRIGGKISFQMPGEPPVAAFARDDMVATATAQFVDYWKKIH